MCILGVAWGCLGVFGMLGGAWACLGMLGHASACFGMLLQCLDLLYVCTPGF